VLVAFLVLRHGDGDGDDAARSAAPAASQPATTAIAPDTTTDPTTTEADTPQVAAPPAPSVRTVRVVNGQPQGGVRTLSYDKGDVVRLRVRSDIADEIHIHGYDLKKDVRAGGSVQFRFTADIEGRFEIELEDAGTQIANVEVHPS
jgi:hypothetical protein